MAGGGLIVNVVKACGEAEAMTLVGAFGEPVQGPFEPTESRPAVMVIWGPSVGGVRSPIAVPAGWSEEQGAYLVKRGDGVGPMFGGRFIFTSDGRFGEALRPANGRGFGAPPVALHDRWESKELYEANR